MFTQERDCLLQRLYPYQLLERYDVEHDMSQMQKQNQIKSINKTISDRFKKKAFLVKMKICS